VLRLPAAVFAGVFAVVLVLDQLTKALVRTFMDPPGTTVNVVGRLLMFVHVRNAGASFGMLPGYAPVFMGVTTLVLAGVAVYWFRVRPRRALLVVALAVVTAGAVGNLIDRATAGLVTDFIQLPFGFPVFVWWVLFGPAEHSAAVGDTTGPGTSPPAVGVDVSSQPTECDPASPETTDGG
jgi:signal peptidase II